MTLPSSPHPVTPSSRRILAGLALLLLVGGVLRWRYLSEISLYVDEFTTMWAARRILELGVPIMPSGVLYTRGLLASYLEAAFLGVLGFTYPVARLPNLLFGLATIPLLFAVGKRFWGERVGWLAALGLTLLPEAIIWSGRARFYAQLQFFTLLTAAASLLALREPRPTWRGQLSFAFLFILALYSQEQTILLYPAWLLAPLLWRGWRFLMRPPVLVSHALCLLAMALRYAIEILGQPGYFETIQAQRPYLSLLPDLAATWNAYADLLVAPARLPWTLAALGTVALALWAKKREGEGQATLFFALLFGTMFGIILLFVGETWRDHRYLFIVQPFWLLLGAAGVVAAVERLVARRVQPLVLSGVAVAACLSLGPLAWGTLTTQQEGYDLALAYVAGERAAGDVVLTPQPPACALLLGPCDYYAIQHGYEEYVIRRRADGALVDRWSGAPLLNSAEQLEEVLRAAPRTWFVADGFRLATRYDAPFLKTVIEQFDPVWDERGIVVLRAEGWRSPPPFAVEKAVEPPARFDPLMLMSWARGEATAGEELSVQLTWQAAERVDRAITTFAHLIGSDGSRVAQEDGPPARGMVPTVLFDEKPLPDPKTLALPPDLPAGRYRLDVGAYEEGTLAPLSGPLALDWVTVGPPPAPPTQPLDARWENGLRLLGHDGLPRTLRPGESVTIRLVWNTDEPLGEGYTIFVHLAGADGRPLAQSDRAPEGGFYPTSAWEVGERVADEYTLTLPTDLPPGSYTLITGLYRPTDFARLPTLDGGDHLTLATIAVR